MMTKKTLKQLIQLSGFILLLVGCSTDELEIKNTHETDTNEQELITELISYESLYKEKSSIVKSISIFKHELNVNYKNIAIDDVYAKYIQTGNYHSYTFSLLSQSDNVQNLVFSINNSNTYSLYLVEYTLNPQYLKYLILNEDYETINENTFFRKLEIKDDFNYLLCNDFNRDPINECPAGSCCEVNNVVSQATGWIVQEFAVIPCDTPAGGSTGGDYGQNPNGSSNIPGDSTGYNGWNGTNGSSGGGGGSSTNNQNNNSDPNCIADANGNCAGTLTTPLLPDSTLIEDLGNKRLLKDLMAETSFQTHFEILKTASIATAEKREILYAGLTNDAGETIFSYVGQSPINGAEVEIINPIIGEISSLFHNHYAGTSNQGNLLPTFSAADVSNIFSLAYTSQIQDLNDFNLLLVTPQQDLQALMITDRELFNTRLNTWGGFPEQLALFLQNNFNENQITPGSSSENGAMKLNNILRDYGLTVYQFNENTDRWFKP